MASIKGVSLKGVKKTVGREGEGFTANIYLNGKKVGEFADYADGAMGDYSLNKEAEKTIMLAAFAYGKTRPNPFLVKLYKERPAQYQQEVEHVKNHYPYIPEEDITMESIAYASNGIEIFVSDIYFLKCTEDFFKKMKKKGYSAVGIKNHKHDGFGEVSAYPPSYSDERIKADGCSLIFKELEDFNLA